MAIEKKYKKPTCNRYYISDLDKTFPNLSANFPKGPSIFVFYQIGFLWLEILPALLREPM